MTQQLSSQLNAEQPVHYQIRLQGHLDQQWRTWFDGLHITLTADGDTLLTGPVIDQAALHGLLKKVRDLGMPLLSVIRVDAQQTAVSAKKAEDNPEE